MRAAANASKWQGFARENGRTSVESASGAKFTAFDPHGTAHHMVRPASTVGSDDSSPDDSENDTIPDPREQARISKEEVCILALFLMTNTDCISQRDARSRFARIPGGRAAPVVVPTYVGGRTVPDPKPSYDDDDEEDDDWGTI